jgi:CRISPR/Cas system-associated exonuclease Cas4 (RecB family)
MFKEKIEQKNKNIREILEDVLNEMSSAVNSFWNFQIVEGQGDDANIQITVVDENWIGQNPEPEKIKIFKHNGIGSPFLNASLNVSIPADMANKIINERLGNNSQPDMQNIKVGTLFNATTDLFLKKTTPTTEEDDTTEVEGDAEIERKKARLVELKSKVDERIDTERTKVDDNGQTTYKNKSASTLYVINKDGVITYFNTNEAVANGLNNSEREEIGTLIEEVKTSANEAIKNRITSNLDKIDIVPIPPVTFPVEFTVDTLHKKIKKFFMIFCYDDTDFFDKMKNYWFDNKLRLAGGTKGLSHPLPIKYSFTILGNSGIRRGDTFNIDGIPAKYKNNGVFQVTEIEHSISNMRWETNVTGQYRQLQ